MKSTTIRKMTPCRSRCCSIQNACNLSTSGTNFFVLFLCCCMPLYTVGYNLDLPSFIRHQSDKPGTMFGFSIALHKGPPSAPGYTQNWVVIGAPKGDTSAFQQNIERAGAVYRCDIQDDNRCYMVPFDSKGNQKNDRGEQIDTKSNQWLGATVTSSMENGLVVACAPRYIFHSMTPSHLKRYEPVGTCFTSRNFTSFTELSPCRTNYWGYHRQGSCQAGFSAATSKKGDRLFIGAPGSWYWQGQAFSIDPEARYPYKPPMYQDFGAGGQTYSYDVTRPENKVYATGESSSNDDDSYLGYSMVSGDFDGDGEEDIAIGMPRGAGLLGKVVLYKWNMVNILNITGWQIGAYFGYSMCTVDVDGDSFDDLIIGAPMYSEPNNEGKYDVGRVYIMLQGKQPSVQGKFLKEATRDGYNSKGRFGLALTSLGDINLDGFGDFAVGAPYDGPDGRGAVYIFHGSPDGPLLKASQVIHAEDIIGGNYPRTFGFSLAGGVDMDGNLYPDLAVGAYVSDQVYVFRSRPVAVVDATATFISPTKLINLDDKTCTTVRDGKKVTCTDVKSCWKYNGVNLPKFLDFQVSWVLDAKKSKTPRMFFLLDEGKNIRNSTIRLERGKSLCSNETVYLIENVQDKLTPLEVEMRYQLRNNHFGYNVRRKRADLEPVIDQNREIVQRDSLNIQKNCGMDNICVPDLRLEIKTVDKYLLGSREPLTIEVLITNFGEDAFEAAFYMVMPKDLDFKKIQQSDNSRDIPITCTAPTSATNYTLKCDVGNPLPSNKLSKFKVVMIPSHKAGMAPSYDFFMEANSTNVEVQGSAFDNVIRKSIGIWVETDLSIEGTSLPDFQHYKASEFKLVENATNESDLGPHVVHIYNIRNNGPSTIEEAVVFIHYPYQTLGDDVLMYLLNQPETDGNIRCDPHINVNPLNLVLDQSLSRKSYLESIGAVIRSGSTASHIHVEQSGGRTSSSASATTIGQGTRIFTEEEKRRLKEEDNLESAGDASFVHSQRANTAATSAGLVGGRQAYTSSSSWNSSSSDGHRPAVIVQTRNRTVSYGPDGKPFVYETSTEYVHNLDRPQYVSSHSAAYQQGGGRGTANVYRAGGRNVDAESQWQTQAKPINNENVRHSLQSTRGHVQMAAAPGAGGSGYRQSQSQNNYNGAESSGSHNNQGSSFYGSSSDAGYNRGNLDGFSDLNARSSMEKIAQGGHGFRTGTLDLGQLNRKNVDDELRNRALRSGTISGGDSTAQHLAQSSSSSNYGLNVDNEEPDNDDGYYYDQDETNSSGNHHESFSSSSSSSSSKSQRGNAYDHRRTRRQTAAEELNNIDLSSPCKTTKCATLRCVATSLGNNEGVWVAVRTRLVAKTMEKLASNVPLNVSTMAISHVTKLPYIGAPKDDIIRSHEIFYKAIPEPIPVPDVVPMWVVVLAACVGAIILLLLAFLLYKCGFFKRNRPSDNSQERQPLRNGYHGDEHL